MTTTVQTQSEYRDLPLDWLVVSPTNPRKTFDEDAMQELAASIRENGVLQPLLVRPRAERSFEIVFGERRYRGAAMAEKETVPVCIREMTDAQVLEAQLVENLQRQDVHPLHEAQGFAALLRLEEPKYSIELIAAKCGKSAGYVASRLRLTELAPAAVEAFTKDEIGLGHALLLAKLQPRTTGGSVDRLLAGELYGRQQGEAHPAARSPSAGMDRAQHSLGTCHRAVLERGCNACARGGFLP